MPRRCALAVASRLRHGRLRTTPSLRFLLDSLRVAVMLVPRDFVLPHCSKVRILGATHGGQQKHIVSTATAALIPRVTQSTSYVRSPFQSLLSTRTFICSTPIRVRDCPATGLSPRCAQHLYPILRQSSSPLGSLCICHVVHCQACQVLPTISSTTRQDYGCKSYIHVALLVYVMCLSNAPQFKSQQRSSSCGAQA